jgi:hypothetical protein
MLQPIRAQPDQRAPEGPWPPRLSSHEQSSPDNPSHNCRLKSTIIAAACAIWSIHPGFAAAGDFGPSNPFFAPCTLWFRAPPFDKTRNQDQFRDWGRAASSLRACWPGTKSASALFPDCGFRKYRCTLVEPAIRFALRFPSVPDSSLERI